MDWSLPIHHQLLEFTHSCPLSWRCHPTVSSSVVPFSSCLQSFLQSFPASGSFPMSQFFASSGQSTGVSASALVLLQNRLLLGGKVMTNLDNILKSRDITLPTKVHLVKAMVFPLFMYGCESWTIKKAIKKDYKECQRNWCFWTAVLEKTLESPLDCKEIQPLNPKGNHSWIFTGRTDAEAETPILWPPDVKNSLTGKDPDAGKDWRQEEKGDNRGWDGWMAAPTLWTWVWASSLWELVMDREAWHAAVHGVEKSRTWLSS